MFNYNVAYLASAAEAVQKYGNEVKSTKIIAIL